MNDIELEKSERKSKRITCIENYHEHCSKYKTRTVCVYVYMCCLMTFDMSIFH